MAAQFLSSLSRQIIPDSFMQFLHFQEKEAKGATQGEDTCLTMQGPKFDPQNYKRTYFLKKMLPLLPHDT